MPFLKDKAPSNESAPQTLKEKLAIAKRAIKRKSKVFLASSRGDFISGPATKLKGTMLTLGNGESPSVQIVWHLPSMNGRRGERVEDNSSLKTVDLKNLSIKLIR